MDAPLALYRRYRPETFAEVIGQDHVTAPLRQALAANKVNHAYLFSGPRGCGKTTSARILARALNCEKAPISDPCGECQSCRDLARGGPGSIDVIEIDAASHGNVDDARDLREKAFFAPVNSKYKVYIIDEAHMVSTHGFNALLKLVEEPPPHLKFIFATTEPDKVIGTIRSRTHHYPFRLVPPRLLTEHLQTLCDAEGVQIDPAALPLVVRAGGGSVRDTLSVMDQLMSGAPAEGVTYQLATQLLGYTPDTLIDEAIAGFAQNDGPQVFSVIDRVMESGQDPRRFTEDLLQRWRDLVILTAVPQAIETGLLDVPGDRAEVLRTQVSAFTPGSLVRAADIVSTALGNLRGATAPRMMLELMCARILVPAADASAAGINARIDRIEQLVQNGGGLKTAAAAPQASAPAAPAVAPTPAATPTPEPTAAQVEPPAPATPSEPAPVQEEPTVAAPESAQSPVETAPAPAATPAVETRPEPTPEPGPTTPTAPEPVRASEPEPATPAAATQASTAGTTAEFRQHWPQILEAVKGIRRFTWVLLNQNAQVTGIDGNSVTLGFVNAGARSSFESGSSVSDLQAAIEQVTGKRLTIDAIIDPTASPAPAQAAPAAPATPEPPRTAAGADMVREAMSQQPAKMTPSNPDDAVSMNDPILEESSAGAEELLAEHLGAEIIEEPHLP